MSNTTTPLVDIVYFGGETPVQCWGTIAGKHFYFRARWNYWSFGVGEQQDLPVVADDDIDRLNYYKEQEYGNDPYSAGYMPFDESKNWIIECIRDYLSQGSGINTKAIQVQLDDWFANWKRNNPDYQAGSTM